jgi:hypothetical protein
MEMTRTIKVASMLFLPLLLTGCVSGGYYQVGNGPRIEYGDPRATPGNPQSLLPEVRTGRGWIQVQPVRFIYLDPGERYFIGYSHWGRMRDAGLVRCKNGRTPRWYQKWDGYSRWYEIGLYCPR